MNMVIYMIFNTVLNIFLLSERFPNFTLCIDEKNQPYKSSHLKGMNRWNLPHYVFMDDFKLRLCSEEENEIAPSYGEITVYIVTATKSPSHRLPTS